MVVLQSIVLLGVISHVYCVLKPAGRRGGFDDDEFTPVFRMYSDDDWDSKDDYLSQERSARDGDRDDSQFRSWAMDQWRHLGIQKVKVEIYDDGDEVAEFEFDGHLHNSTGFFNSMGLKRSSYDDIPTERSPGRFMGDEFGFDDDRDDDRHWRINGRHMGDCRNDDGWFQVLDKPRPGRAKCVCGYENVRKYPAIMYAKGNRKTRWSDGNFGYADMMQISVSQKPHPSQPSPTQIIPTRFVWIETKK